MGSINNGSVEPQTLLAERLARNKQTCILTLTFPNLEEAGDLLQKVKSGIHAWELRCDLLSPAGEAQPSNVPPADYVAKQVRYLRSRSTLPILFSLWTTSRGGRFPDNEPKVALALLSLAVDLGCDYVECHDDWPQEQIDEVVSKVSAKSVTEIVGAHHASNDAQWTSATVEDIHARVAQYANIVRLSLPAKKLEDCYELAQFTKSHTQSKKPFTAIATGPNGRLSRFTAPITFVTHPSLPFAASPDLPTVVELNQAKQLLGQLPKKKFHIFGHNISHSLSPTLHNAGFAELGLPHHYSIHETESVDATVEDLINRENFGGASVTFPHKLQVGRLLDSLSLVAAKVGAVNTVIVRTVDGQRTLMGDNTDWLGIKRCVVSASLSDLQSSAALVLGAGGAARAACYAVEDMGIKDLIIVNRTRSKAEDMAASFPACNTHVFDTLEAAALNVPSPIRLIVACVPADDLLEDKIPPALYAADTGVLVEMAYRPQVTGMMKVAERKAGWNIFRGIDVLEEQAYAQFELWLEVSAPTLAMGAAMRAKASRKL